MKSFKQFMSEEDYDRIKDRRMERGGMDGGDDVTPSSGGKKETEAEKTTEEPVAPTLKIPVLDIKMPIPETAVVITAVTTAVVAVATTSVTQTLFEPIKKKVQKQLQAKVNKWKENQKKKKDSSENLKTE